MGTTRVMMINIHGIYDNKVTNDDHVIIFFLYFIKSDVNTTVTTIDVKVIIYIYRVDYNVSTTILIILSS